METVGVQPLPLKNKVRIVTATSLFDGHDASINIMRRLLQAMGAEVIHLGHNRSVAEIVRAAVEEDAQAIAVSSYQGGHMEFFTYMRQMCVELGRPDMKLFGGGGGVIIPSEIDELHKRGVTRIYSPEDGRKLGLEGMIQDILERSDFAVDSWHETLGAAKLHAAEPLRLARAFSILENKGRDALPQFLKNQLEMGIRSESLESKGFAHQAKSPLVLGVTGTGGAGKSSLNDEIIRRFTLEFPERRICVLSVDPSKKKSGGALLGDRIRMNAIQHPHVFMRSFATRGSRSELASVTGDAIALARASGFDLIIVETSGIGQGDTGILGVSDLALYVMTSEYGAASQLEKIDMIDFADAIAINKFDRRGAMDAWRDVSAQIRRSRFAGRPMPEAAHPVFGTIASKFNDDGVNALYRHLLTVMSQRLGENATWAPRIELKQSQKSSHASPIIPQNRTHYLAEVSAAVRHWHTKTEQQAAVAGRIQALEKSIQCLSEAKDVAHNEAAVKALEKLLEAERLQLTAELKESLSGWKTLRDNYTGSAYKYQVRGKTLEVKTTSSSLSGLEIPRVSLPKFEDWSSLVRFLRSENVPGSFPYTAGVFPFKRKDEDPKRMFAGEGGPGRTNNRFRFLTQGEPAKRLSTAFDSVTLYGCDPDRRPDIYGKVGESGVSIATLEDMKLLYSGFDLCDTNTSVSMTINGPAPIILAFFMNTALDQQVELHEAKLGRTLTVEEFTELRKSTFRAVRGTVQADILKEDQAQNTCIFSLDFALKMMGDIQEFFIKNDVKNYYSVSISGYHIAEAGANPITQLALTLANGFTYVEYYLSRGMNIDDFAPNLSFFFSNGMDPEYTVIGRVARRIWAIAMQELYKGNDRSQKLKYHIQTSGRSLHAQEMDFNDIRTTLQALLAMNDNCNSLHTNAYDEAITTPTEESVRRSMAIQLVLAREFGLLKNENMLQGSYFVEWLTDAVEEAVLKEFDSISSRGGVLGAMETQYQRGKIQDESLFYERLKHSGELPIVGVNTFLNPRQDELSQNVSIQLARASYEEKDDQLGRLSKFQERSGDADTRKALQKLQATALAGGNIFEELLHTVRSASLGQITQALFAVGGQYRRSL